MRSLKIGLVLAGVSVLSLTACSKKSDETVTTETTTTAPAAAASAGPTRKAGLWEQTSSAEGLGSMTSKVCAGESLEPCPGATVAKTADGYTFSATCNMGTGGMVKTEGAATGDLNSAYEVNATSTITGAAVPHMNRSVTTKTTMKRLGDCPEGMTVGDQQLSDGATVNMSQFDPAKAKAIADQAAKAGAGAK